MTKFNLASRYHKLLLLPEVRANEELLNLIENALENIFNYENHRNLEEMNISDK